MRFLIGLLAAVLLVTSADARPRHKRHHHRVHAAQGYQVVSLGAFAGGASMALMRARSDLGKTAGQMGLHRSTLWCATAMNRWFGGGTGSDLAKSYLKYPRGTGSVGDVAVATRRGGGHVGLVSGTCEGGVMMISGNNGGRVRESCYPRSRIIAFVRP